MKYTLVSQLNGNYTYNVTLKLYRLCDGGRELNNSTIVSVFNRGNFARIMDITVPLSFTQTLNLSQFAPCITNPPTVCYEVGYFDFSVTLRGNAEGYLLSSQVIYRVHDINNLQFGYGNIGATYTAEIPGTLDVATAPSNSSAEFTGSDLVLVCARNSLSYSFKAWDADGDELRYRFSEAFQSGDFADAGNQSPGTSPPYLSVPYGNGYTVGSPLGTQVTINSTTGLITGIAPDEGVYAVTVCVDEVRNGKVIATQRKDIQIKIANCEIASAVLPPEYLLCENTFTQVFKNLVRNRLIQSQYWEIRNELNNVTFTSSAESPNYTFTDTGVYRIKLVVNPGQECTDSTTSIALVYPGTMAGFTYSGVCLLQPTQFTDASTTQYGTFESWFWNFENASTGSDTNTNQNPVHQYTSAGNKLATLEVTTSKGCKAIVSNPINLTDKPSLQLTFSDTLICKGDTLAIQALAFGKYQWSPVNSLLAANTATPLAFPAQTTTYYAVLSDAGCRNTDSVRVRVADSVQLTVMMDTSICENDLIQLKVISDGLRYAWTPAGLFDDPTEKSPFIRVSTSTSFSVKATTGGCLQTKNVQVNTLALPSVFAGRDTTICYNSAVQLQGVSNATDFYWMPSQNLLTAGSLTPSAVLSQTTEFILTGRDATGCPRPVTDTVTVFVLQKVIASAGNDTSVVVNQPLQLQARGGNDFTWTPPDYLSRTDIQNPVAIFPFSLEKISYTVTVKNEAGCADSAGVNIGVFKTQPAVFIPNAFTPNADGKNDVLRLITAGIGNIEYFRIFNRWGQLIFTTENAAGRWNGNFKGRPQPSGIYVWMVSAKDYSGKPYFKKGVVTLIR